ncbi:helix-turn-helix domain-containing protein [Arthrobacter polaris]|uniref:helix-turn-helix domain-containing protein n=1 Tax=Arthrobacter polaris TaxID=2813727 RepID=UPI001F35DCA4|nr:helix-turn-helix transcriptional regulator [Arthrobacter polaris]UIK88446.1 helix-turn-helix transcriptional regulator [Arthrobacter polaris]
MRNKYIEGIVVMTKPSLAALRLGAAIRERRKSLGVTQAELMERTGISRSNISAMENGRLGHARLLMEVTSALGMDLLAVPRDDSRGRQIRLEQDLSRSQPQAGTNDRAA